MKKSDIMIVVFMATAGIVIAYFLCNAIMPKIEKVSFKTIEAISTDLQDPDPEVFNSAAINPTVETYVGSCVDQDQDGELDVAEAVVCQQQGDTSDIDADKDKDAKDVVDQIESDEAEAEAEEIIDDSK